MLAQRSADQKSLDALSTSPQAGFLNQPQSLWTLWATLSFMYVGKWEYEIRPPCGECRGIPGGIPLRLERLARIRAPARLTVDARPMGSCAATPVSRRWSLRGPVSPASRFLPASRNSLDQR